MNVIKQNKKKHIPLVNDLALFYNCLGRLFLITQICNCLM